MNIQTAQYLFDTEKNENYCIKVVLTNNKNLAVPIDTNNRHYAEIMRQVDAGELTIADAE